MKSKEDNADDEGLFTPPSCFLFACGAFACDFGEGGGDENVIGVTNASSQSHRDIERSGGAWTKNERRRTFEMSMIPEGDEFCITSAKEKKGNEQEEERRDGDDDERKARIWKFETRKTIKVVLLHSNFFSRDGTNSGNSAMGVVNRERLMIFNRCLCSRG